MVTSKGYGMEQHDVTTTDGYILTNFRCVGFTIWLCTSRRCISGFHVNRRLSGDASLGCPARVATRSTLLALGGGPLVPTSKSSAEGDWFTLRPRQGPPGTHQEVEPGHCLTAPLAPPPSPLPQNPRPGGEVAPGTV